MKRFIERFQLWLKERADEREDKFIGWLLFVVVLIITGDVYTFFTAHRVSVDSILGTVLMLAFVVLYIRRARWTWIALTLLAVRCAAYIPLEYVRTSSSHLHPGARLFAVAFLLGLAGAAFVFSLIVRKRFANSTRTI